MRARLPIAALAAVLLALAAGASASPRARVVGDCRHSQVRPSSIILACADGNAAFTRLHWESFGGDTAHATGSYAFNDCTPTCVAGHVHSYPRRDHPLGGEALSRRPSRLPQGGGGLRHLEAAVRRRRAARASRGRWSSRVRRRRRRQAPTRSARCGSRRPPDGAASRRSGASRARRVARWMVDAIEPRPGHAGARARRRHRRGRVPRAAPDQPRRDADLQRPVRGDARGRAGACRRSSGSSTSSSACSTANGSTSSSRASTRCSAAGGTC